jgi:hypothetical protein
MITPEPPDVYEEERFRHLANLPLGWDSYGANRIDPDCIDRARSVLTALRGPVSISGTVGGGIFLTWQDEHVTFEIDPGGRLTASVGDDYASSDLDAQAAASAAVPDTGQARPPGVPLAEPRNEEELIAWQRETVRRWVCDSDPSRVEHTSFVGWSPCPSCRVIEPSADTVQAPESPTDSTPEAGRGGSGEAETATGAVQTPDAADLAYARSEVDKWLADGDPYCILPTRTEHIPALLARLDELEGTS